MRVTLADVEHYGPSRRGHAAVNRLSAFARAHLTPPDRCQRPLHQVPIRRVPAGQRAHWSSAPRTAEAPDYARGRAADLVVSRAARSPELQVSAARHGADSHPASRCVIARGSVAERGQVLRPVPGIASADVMDLGRGRPAPARTTGTRRAARRGSAASPAGAAGSTSTAPGGAPGTSRSRRRIRAVPIPAAAHERHQSALPRRERVRQHVAQRRGQGHAPGTSRRGGQPDHARRRGRRGPR